MCIITKGNFPVFYSLHTFLGKIVSGRERPDVSGPIRSIEMYSYDQCTIQERLVCCGDVPCLAHMEQGSGPLHSGHPPLSLSARGNGDSVY
jgi:hypothetical protein